MSDEAEAAERAILAAMQAMGDEIGIDRVKAAGEAVEKMLEAAGADDPANSQAISDAVRMLSLMSELVSPEAPRP